LQSLTAISPRSCRSLDERGEGVAMEQIQAL
jgi:hypothetical protein